MSTAAEPQRTYRSETPDAGRLFEQHSDRLFAYCLHLLRSHGDAEDAVQTTFLYAHRALQRGVVPESEYAWLHSIAKNVCRWHSRTAARRGVASGGIEVDDLPGRSERDDDERELVAALPEALASLPEAQRQAFLLREWRGLSSAEVASQLGMSAPATYALLTRARRSLGRALTATTRKPLLGLDFGSLFLKLKGLLAGGTAQAVAASVAVVSVAVGGVAIEKVVERERLVPQHAIVQERDPGSSPTVSASLVGPAMSGSDASAAEDETSRATTSPGSAFPPQAAGDLGTSGAGDDPVPPTTEGSGGTSNAEPPREESRSSEKEPDEPPLLVLPALPTDLLPPVVTDLLPPLPTDPSETPDDDASPVDALALDVPPLPLPNPPSPLPPLPQ